MLDDLKMIHQRDAQDALGVAEKQWQQLEQSFEFAPALETGQPRNIVFAGMGGSALAALIAQVWPGFAVPFEIVRDYTLPQYVGGETLFFASSYSGNTEETLSALAEAEQRGANIVVITSGGQLADIARAKGYPLATLPGGLQPRHAVFYSLKALLTATDAIGITEGTRDELASKAPFLKTALQAWLPTVPTKKNLAKRMALEVIGKSAVVYAGPKLWPAAYKWKISFNENAKHIAWANQFSEFNHNEMMGWTKQPTEKPYAVIELHSALEHPRIQKRFEVTGRLLSGLRPEPIAVEVSGDDLLEQLLYAIALGDFVTLYTALLNGINPTPVDLIEKFKKQLDT
ncbi:MAG TPA: bifunctional phosphoglucose/phosphomannose isomerase [Candidatus Saccharimonadales bacterium]|nr:bifunctional phosphoglucose/phosphomannose isomerase [Candidatus Saccharimonadales bacterium]